MVDVKKPQVRRGTLELPAPKGKDGGKGSDDLGIPPPAATIRMPPASERWESDTDLAHTLKLGSTQAQPNQKSPGPPRPSRAPRATEPPKSGVVEGIELVVVEEKHSAGGERRPWRAAEVWTKRRIYGLDSTFRCVEILDRETGRPETRHELLGARLGGGRKRDKEQVRFSYPLPLPGMEAMFSKGKKHGYTSAVERMIVRVRVLQLSADEAPPSWEEIASRWSDMPPQMP